MANTSLLFVAGGYTFAHVKDNAQPSKDVTRVLAKAYGSLGYDLGMLTPDEIKLLDSHGVSAPRAWTKANKVLTKTYVQGGTTLGFVMIPDSEALEEAKKAARELKADILIALSALGISTEKVFVEAEDNPFHLVLGSGQGTGVNGKMSENGRCLWMRAYPKGKAVQLIDILAKPGTEGWQKGQNIRWQTKPLKDTIADDRSMAEILKDLP